MPDKFLSIDQVSDRCQLSKPTIWRLQREGLFPPFEQISARRKALKESVFQEWLDGRRNWG